MSLCVCVCAIIKGSIPSVWIGPLFAYPHTHIHTWTIIIIYIYNTHTHTRTRTTTTTRRRRRRTKPRRNFKSKFDHDNQWHKSEDVSDIIPGLRSTQSQLGGTYMRVWYNFQYSKFTLKMTSSSGGENRNIIVILGKQHPWSEQPTLMMMMMMIMYTHSIQNSLTHTHNEMS